ncbi:MAG: plasmid pRiA4b ORF-3 family protein [Treponema sp.]|nr:plasmid pRiA4b ORF-3 family protein [Treponema sp.]
MTLNQEEALYNFLEDTTHPFTLKTITDHLRAQDTEWIENLPVEIAAFFASTTAAFRLDKRRWISRRGVFESVPFVISPTKLELLNGILIPGHRCLPFANPTKMPHEYEFFWEGNQIPWTTTEGPPDEFYPYYNIFGREYAPQIVARDNPENENAFMNSDPYEDPLEVSIHTLDMRNIFREAAFVPGDRFVVKTRDWKRGYFDLEKVGKGEWSKSDLDEWAVAAENGFEGSFTKMGPGTSTEEQIAFAYWHGGNRMRELPAYSLEIFLYEITENIENMDYGIESRFWFAGKDIPDSKGLLGASVPPDRTPIEDMLFDVNVPVSEYVIRSYVRDALFKNEKDVGRVVERIVPQAVNMDNAELNILAEYIAETMVELSQGYNIFLDQPMGAIRRQIGELHHAVVELSAQIQRWEMDETWLPKHTFIMLSQIQEHAAELLTDLDSDEAPPNIELEAMDSSLESMVETFTDIKDMLKDAMNNYRRSNLQLVHADRGRTPGEMWQTVQISVGGTDVWRRVIVPGSWKLGDLHKLIQICLDWKDSYRHHFYSMDPERKTMDGRVKVRDVRDQGISRIEYEYGTRWTVRIIFVSSYQPGNKETVRCVAGENAAPPEKIGGPLRFRKMLTALSGGNELERQTALSEMGQDFSPGVFDKEKCNRNLHSMFSAEK